MAVLLASQLWACADQPDQLTLLERTAAALGGSDALLNTASERVEASGTRLDPGESRAIGEAIKVADFTYNLTHSLDADRLHLELTSSLPPFAMSYVQVIDGQRGYMEGRFGLFNPVAAALPLPPAQITTRLKHTLSTSILAVLHRALSAPQAVTEAHPVLHDGRQHPVLVIDSPEHAPLRLVIDPDSHLPAKLETLEHSYPIGDTLVEVDYADYRAAGDLLLPHSLRIRVDGVEIQREDRSRIELAASDAAADYTVPASFVRPFDAAAGEPGWLSTQLLETYEVLGMPFLFDVYSQESFQFTLVELAPGVFHVQGATHQMLVVELADHLLLVDAPIAEAHSRALRAALAERWPAKPVRTVVASHFHADHTGGIRHFGAGEPLTVVAGQESVEFYRRVFANPYTVVPDRYSASPTPVRVEGIGQAKTLTDGARLVEVHKVVSTHAADMVVVHLPAEKILFNSDMYNPGPGPLAGFVRAGASELQSAAAALGLPPETTLVGAHSPLTITLGQLGELLATP